ncbi:MAG: hypothetical protein LBI86_01715 [Treponema sp.]|jgi:hypothetical protein|nr:hypothetical protein [Treponema sp.]
MKKNIVLSAAAFAVLLALGLILMGCATASSIGGTADTHGLISKARVVSDDSQELASYSVILGLFDSGYEEYAAEVRQAEAGGKAVTTVTTSYFGFFTKIKAYTK